MIDATANRAEGAKAFDFSRVHTCRIHPGIGIARVGNSPDEYFIGPEAPCRPRDVTAPSGGFKDAQGRVKRQAARFRIYAYDSEEKILGELPVQGADDLEGGSHAGPRAEVQWTVHLKNKKAAWYKFFTWGDHKKDPDLLHHKVRNCDVRVPTGQLPDSRGELVIDPRPRCIDGCGHPGNEGGPESASFDTGTYRGTCVPLGELRVDGHGRLLVLGGFGKSGSTKPDNPIGADPNSDDSWANNDYWYDDISDGPITAMVRLPPGPDGKSREIPITDPKSAAWVVVAPPKFAVGVYPIVTLYDVIREVAIDEGWIVDDPKVDYRRDIEPILLRAADTAWVNDEARRGHGYDKGGHFGPDLAADDRVRARIFRRIRNPLLPAGGQEAKDQAIASFMPPLSGDEDERTEGEPTTWLSLLPSQYRKFKKWKDGEFDEGQVPRFPAFEDIDDPAEQVIALQRAALEPCVGGALFPGIEMSWTVREKDLYAAAFRINSDWHRPGDITKYMCVPWQADFYDCKDTWWPAARPDDVIPQKVFEEVDKAWRPGQPQVSEALEGRVKWDRGLGVSTLFRRPWQNPAEAIDDPRNAEWRGCDDMVRYWSELGFVVPRQTAWRGEDPKDREIVQVETERRPYAGMDVRELFHCLLNLDAHRDCLPKVEEFVENVLEAGRRMQLTAGAFAWMDNIRPFKYDEEIFDQRMKDIYDDCADFAFVNNADGVRQPYDAGNIDHNPYFRTRENVIERIRQLTPFNFLDGAWLRNIHRVGPVDEVNSILFTILKEELGDGVPSQNHANIYRDLCHSFGFYPPPMESTAFARDPEFLDAAFDSPAFQLGISEFSKRYYPEIIGMSLWLEWTVLELHRIALMVERVKLSSHFYRMHIAIDNAASGHGASIVRAVKLYLRQVRTEGGEPAVQQHWKRIWDGYVAFAYTFVIIIKQVIRIIQDPPSLQQRLEWLISKKRPYGEFNHSRMEPIGGRSINSWFSDPAGFLMALANDRRFIIPGKPNRSPFFKLLEFRGGPMYHVFTEDEIKLWRDWIWELGEEEKKRSGAEFAALKTRLSAIDPQLPGRLSDDDLDGLLALRDRLEALNPDLVRQLPDEMLLSWQQAAANYRIALWVELASMNSPGKKRRSHRQRATDTQDTFESAKRWLDSRFKDWLAHCMIRAVTFVAAEYRTTFDGDELSLPNPETNENLTIGTWLDQIRDAPNSAGAARAFLVALCASLQNQGGEFERAFGKETPFACALRTGTPPGNDGRRAMRTMEAWIAAGYPLPPKVSQGPVKALGFNTSLSGEERHPTGVIMGFGTVH